MANSYKFDEIFTKDQTVVVSVRDNESVSPEDIIDEIEKKCGVGAVMACVPKIGTGFEVVLKERKFVGDVSDDLSIKGKQIKVKELTSRIKIVSIINLSMYVSNEEIIDRFKKIGVEIISEIKKRKMPSRTTVYDGTRIFKAQLPPTLASIPYSMKFSVDSKETAYYRVVHNDQVKVCSGCFSTDHIYKNCPEFRCYNCGEQGHIGRHCPENRCKDCGYFKTDCRCRKKRYWGDGFGSDVKRPYFGNRQSFTADVHDTGRSDDRHNDDDDPWGEKSDTNQNENVMEGDTEDVDDNNTQEREKDRDDGGDDDDEDVDDDDDDDDDEDDDDEMEQEDNGDVAENDGDEIVDDVMEPTQNGSQIEDVEEDERVDDKDAEKDEQNCEKIDCDNKPIASVNQPKTETEGKESKKESTIYSKETKTVISNCNKDRDNLIVDIVKENENFVRSENKSENNGSISFLEQNSSQIGDAEMEEEGTCGTLDTITLDDSSWVDADTQDEVINEKSDKTGSFKLVARRRGKRIVPNYRAAKIAHETKKLKAQTCIKK